MTDPAAIAVRDAATVMLVRDGSDARLEVFMLRRNLRSDFVGGAYVFPGGAVDPADRHADLEPICEGRTDADASTGLGLDPPRVGSPTGSAADPGVVRGGGRAARLRRSGRSSTSATPPSPSASTATAPRSTVRAPPRRDLRRGGLRWRSTACHYFATGSRRSARPGATTPGSSWPPRPWADPPARRPGDDRQLLDRPGRGPRPPRAGEFDLILPTIRNLEAIARFDTAAELLAAAAALVRVPAILPRVVDDGDGVRILLPGDPGYDGAGDGLPTDLPLPGRPGGPAT
jgi:hypothetical protein